MRESLPAHALARRCRKSWKIPLTCDFGQVLLTLRCDQPLACKAPVPPRHVFSATRPALLVSSHLL
jgi:hypothetical protein